MKIVICIKPTLSKYLSIENNEQWSINPYDLYSINLALELKKNNDLKIICICMGPKNCQQLLKRCLAFGIDEVYLISDKSFAKSDTFSTGYILFKAIKYIGIPDAIFCGKKSLDGETGQVPYHLSQFLNIPLYIGCKKIEITSKNKVSLVMNKNCSSKITILPNSILTFDDFSTEIPKTNLYKLKNAYSKKITTLDSEKLNVNKNLCGKLGAKTNVLKVEKVFHTKCSYKIEGNTDNIALKIYNIMNNKN